MIYPDFDELLKLGGRAGGLSLTSHRQVTSVTSGEKHSPFRGSGMEFKEVRQYAYGDDVRYIDWRVTARTGSPHLKVFSEERERSVIICVDANHTMRFGTRGTFKSVQAARAAAYIGWKANDNHDLVGASVFGNVKAGMQFYAPIRSRRSLWQMLKTLSSQEDKNLSYITLEETLKHLNKAAPTGALVCIISDFININSELEKQLGNLRKRCDIIIFPVNDPADKEIPSLGNVIFSNDNGQAQVNTSNKTGSKLYQQQWEENKHQLQEMVRKLQLGVINLYTNKDVYNDLKNGLIKISRRRA